MVELEEDMLLQPVEDRQSFSVPIQITLHGARRRQMREAFAAGPCKAKKKDSCDGVKGADKTKKQVSNAGEDRAMLLGFTMMGLSVLMFFLLGITILKPYMQSVWKEEANCTTVQTDIMDEWVDCAFTCGVDCHGQSKYPCLQILVNLSHSGQKAILHYNEEAAQTNPKCFYVPKCQRDKNDLLNNAIDIKEFFDQKNNTPFSCYYSPESNSEDVILNKKFDRMIVFHCLFWPSLMLIGGALIVGMVKLTQHLSMLCEEYCSSTKDEVANTGSRSEVPESRPLTTRWMPNLRSTHHSPLR